MLASWCRFLSWPGSHATTVPRSKKRKWDKIWGARGSINSRQRRCPHRRPASSAQARKGRASAVDWKAREERYQQSDDVKGSFVGKQATDRTCTGGMAAAAGLTLARSPAASGMCKGRGTTQHNRRGGCWLAGPAGLLARRSYRGECGCWSSRASSAAARAAVSFAQAPRAAVVSVVLACFSTPRATMHM